MTRLVYTAQRLGFLLSIAAVAALLFGLPRLAALGMALGGLLCVAVANHHIKPRRESDDRHRPPPR